MARDEGDDSSSRYIERIVTRNFPVNRIITTFGNNEELLNVTITQTTYIRQVGHDLIY